MKLTVFLLAAIPPAAAPRSNLPLDLDWRFLKADRKAKYSFGLNSRA